MSKKRVTLVEKDKKQEAKVYPNVIKKRGKKELVFIVRGWKTDGKWQRKQFTDEAKAEAYAVSVNINLKNQGEERKLVLTTLNDDQVREAEDTFRQLGNTYTMTEVTEFFLKHNRPPKFTIDMADAIEIYLTHKAKRARSGSVDAAGFIVKMFARYVDNAEVHTITSESIEMYLETLRGADKISPAKKNTWNTHRTELGTFFKYALKKDTRTGRPWTFNDPVTDVHAHSQEEIDEEMPKAEITPLEELRDLMTYAMNYKDGKMVKFYALAYFAGIRPDLKMGEMAKLSKRESELIKLDKRVIEMPAGVAKNKYERVVSISNNLLVWLQAFEGKPINPPNGKHEKAHFIKKYQLQRDETRHSFISYHIGLHRSASWASEEAGNTEQMIRKHYRVWLPRGEGEEYFSIVPDMKNKKAVIIKQKFDKPDALRAI
jgi:site-specific recombinase XerD